MTSLYRPTGDDHSLTTGRHERYRGAHRRPARIRPHRWAAARLRALAARLDPIPPRVVIMAAR